jgi:hypothetical protein
VHTQRHKNMKTIEERRGGRSLLALCSPKSKARGAEFPGAATRSHATPCPLRALLMASARRLAS